MVNENAYHYHMSSPAIPQAPEGQSTLDPTPGSSEAGNTGCGLLSEES
jgi:hypothetical protein